MNTIDKYTDSAVMAAFLTRDFSGVGYEYVDDVLTSMKDYAFAGITDLETLSLPNITMIPNCAFLGTRVSTSVTLPWDKITQIGAYAFYESNVIKGGVLNMPLLTTICTCAFAGQTALTSLNAPLWENIYLGSAPFSESRGMFEGSGIQSISAPKINSSTFSTRAFKDCTALTSVYLPLQEYDGERMFDGCSSLVNLSLPKLTGVTHQNMFSGCTALESVSLPAATAVSAMYAFSGCTALKSISLPEVTGALGTGTFSGCSAMESANLPKVTGIPASCFSGCTSLTSAGLSIPMAATLGSTAFYECSGLTTFSSSTITSTGTNCFGYCSNLEEVTLSALTTIGTSTFAYCSGLKKVTLGGEITAFGNYIFRSCSNLETLILSGVTAVPTISSNTFTGATKILNGTGTIYVPDALVASFEADATWGTYTIKGTSEYVEEE